MLRLLTEYRHKRFSLPRCTVPGVRFATARNTIVQRVSLSIGLKQLCSASSFAAGPPQHSTLWLVVRCSRRSYSPKERSSPRRRCPQDQRFARVLLPSHLCAQAASHSTADKPRHGWRARVLTTAHQKMHKPLTFDNKQTPHFSCCGAPHPQIPKNKQTNPSLLSLLIAHNPNNKQTPHLCPTPPTLACIHRRTTCGAQLGPALRGPGAPRHPLPHAARKLRFCVAATALSRRFYPLNRGIERCYRSFHKQCAKTCASVCCRCGHVPRSVCLCYRLGCPAKMSYPLIFTLSHSPVIRNRSLCLPHLSPTLVVRCCNSAEASPLPPSHSPSPFHLMAQASPEQH